ncbi:MAG: 2TM domain-containing protein [Candidatus Nanoarchaeia archaeon]
MVYNVLRRERPEPEGRASHRSVTDGGRGLLTVYILVNTMLITINILYSPGEIWFFFPLLGWGIGLVSHYVGSIAWID